ncbi:aldo/keto reductase [Bradyrhizobium sp. 174]|nr:aldo/keto reductase [Bradyrhizobium sp. 17]MCK1574559.1 aldo/keto reductase [Bradyrhizobium sp. 174]MCK1690229.1 aldo/keto reductase [Bradyrhizobium sp. 145]UPJ99585.1 aldo/keto reductase [Bradyrhizobium sp. 172]
MTNSAPQLTLNNGIQMPAIGFGVFQSAPEETAAAVQSALEVGYRHIDTAAAYFNEREVGEGLRRSGIPRDEVFIETKVWVSDYGYEEALHAFEKSAKKLGVEQLDLLLLHQPLIAKFDRNVEAYKALEKLLADCAVRAIGVSNLVPARLDALLAETDIVPAVNQIELHPYNIRAELQAKNAAHGILTQAWSPIGGIRSYNGETSNPLNDPTIRSIGEEHGKTNAQVILRWHLQQGRSAIPKSINPGRIAENFDVFDFELTNDELARIDALNSGDTIDIDSIDFESFGFVIDEV